MGAEFIAAGEPGGRGADPAWQLALDDFDAFLAAIEAARVAPKEGFVAMTTFWLDADGILVGQSRLRHELSETLTTEGGHIGYSIRPSARRRGSGATILGLTLAVARERGFPRVLVTCDDDNVGSWKIIERNGGVLEDRRASPRSGKPVRRYWIDL